MIRRDMAEAIAAAQSLLAPGGAGQSADAPVVDLL
jgi:hypothetical protein